MRDRPYHRVVADPWVEFSEQSSRSGREVTKGWDWPVTAHQLREELLSHRLKVAQVRLWPGRPRWWESKAPSPLMHVGRLLPDSEERLRHLPPYADCLPLELRVWTVPEAAIERASAALQRDGLPRLMEWLERPGRDAALRSSPGVTVKLEGSTVHLSED